MPLLGQHVTQGLTLLAPDAVPNKEPRAARRASVNGGFGCIWLGNGKLEVADVLGKWPGVVRLGERAHTALQKLRDMGFTRLLCPAPVLVCDGA